MARGYQRKPAGPVVVELDATDAWQQYKGGVLNVSCNGLCGIYPRFASAAPAEELGTRNVAALHRRSVVSTAV